MSDSSITEIRTGRFNNIDVLKTVCAFLIVCIHAPFPGIAGEYFTALSRIAVPIFFMITGYLYPSVVQREGQVRQIKKILRLFFMGNAIYLGWDFLTAIISHDFETFISCFTLKYLGIFLIFNESMWGGTSGTLARSCTF